MAPCHCHHISIKAPRRFCPFRPPSAHSVADWLGESRQSRLPLPRECRRRRCVHARPLRAPYRRKVPYRRPDRATCPALPSRDLPSRGGRPRASFGMIPSAAWAFAKAASTSSQACQRFSRRYIARIPGCETCEAVGKRSLMEAPRIEGLSREQLRPAHRWCRASAPRT